MRKIRVASFQTLSVLGEYYYVLKELKAICKLAHIKPHFSIWEEPQERGIRAVRNNSKFLYRFIRGFISLTNYRKVAFVFQGKLYFQECG